MNVKSSAKIRTASLADADSIIRLLILMHPAASGVRSASPDELAILHRILQQPMRRLLVAEADNVVVGTVDVVVVENLSRNAKPWATVENLMVEPGSRRLGIASELMDAAINFAESNHCYKIQLISNDARQPAHELYRKLGFNAEVSGFRKYLQDVPRE